MKHREMFSVDPTGREKTRTRNPLQSRSPRAAIGFALVHIRSRCTQILHQNSMKIPALVLNLGLTLRIHVANRWGQR